MCATIPNGNLVAKLASSTSLFRLRISPETTAAQVAIRRNDAQMRSAFGRMTALALPNLLQRLFPIIDCRKGGLMICEGLESLRSALSDCRLAVLVRRKPSTARRSARNKLEESLFKLIAVAWEASEVA